MNQTAANPTTKSVALSVAALSSFLTPFMSSALNVALRAIGTEFNLSAVMLSWVSTIFLLAAAAFLVPVGKAADILGRKKIFLGGVLLFTLGSALCAAAPSGALLITFRGLQGIGSALIYSTSVAIVTSIFAPGERGRVLGIVTGAIYLGLSLGPTLGGFLTGWWGWRSIFWLTVPLGLMAAALVFWKLEGEWAEARGEAFDWTGSILYTISLAAVILGFPRLPAAGGIGLTLGGIAGLAFFLRWELKTNHPVLDLNLFRGNPAFTYSNLAALINYTAATASGFLLGLYLLHIKDLTPQISGLILVAQPVIMAFLSPLAGRLSDRVEVRVLSSLGMGMTTLALLIFSFLNQNTPLGIIILALVINGCGFGLFSSPNTNAVMSAVERKSYGVASAILATMRTIGQTFSMGVTTLIFALYLGQVAITPEVHNQFLASLKPLFAIFAVLAFLGVFASLSRGRIHSIDA